MIDVTSALGLQYYFPVNDGAVGHSLRNHGEFGKIRGRPSAWRSEPLEPQRVASPTEGRPLYMTTYPYLERYGYLLT